MASPYYDKSGKEVYDNDIAYADDLNTINNAVDTGFQLVDSAIDAISDDAEFFANKSEKWAEEAEDVEVEPGKFSSKHHATKAEGDSTLTAADRVQTGLDATATAADRVQTGLDVTATAADRVQTGLDVTAASESAAEALASENKAEQWAEEAEDVEVEPGKYSAYHWSQKAEGVQTLIGTGVDNTDPKNPIITIDKSTIGLGNVDNTSDADKPVSTAQQAVIDTLVSKTDATETGGALIPTGTEAQRPVSPDVGTARFNTDTKGFEGYHGLSDSLQTDDDWRPIGGTYDSTNLIHNPEGLVDNAPPNPSATYMSGSNYHCNRWSFFQSGGTDYARYREEVDNPGWIGVASRVSTPIATGDWVAPLSQRWRTISLGAEMSRGGDYTISFDVESPVAGLHSICLSVQNNTSTTYGIVKTFTVTTPSTPERISITINIPETYTRSYLSVSFGMELSLGTLAGATSGKQQAADVWVSGLSRASDPNSVDWRVTGEPLIFSRIKMERGLVATSYTYRDYDVEKGICDYYFKRVDFSAQYTTFGSGAVSGGGITTSGHWSFFAFLEDTQWQSVGTLSLSSFSHFEVLYGSTPATCTGATLRRVGFTFNHPAPAGTSNGSCHWVRTNNVAAYIQWNAEV